MAKLLEKDLSIANKITNFNIQVRDGITIIGGNSATGKTLFFKEKQLYSQRHNDNSHIFINYSNKQDFIQILNNNITDKILFIDNADIVVPININIYRQIRNSNCQFIFFGRDITRYDKNYDNWAELEEISKSNFELIYVFKKAGELWQ